MTAPRQIGIRMTVDTSSVTTDVPRAGQAFERFGLQASQSADRATRSLGHVALSMRDLVLGGAVLGTVTGLVHGLSNAITSLPNDAFNYSRNLEVSGVGMAGILGSMTAINGQQTKYNVALGISQEYIRKLNDDALRTAASSQELVNSFQALLAPGLAAGMNLQEIRELAVVGTNAVKSIGLNSHQVVQEIRDLVGGGITAASSTLATALGLKDEDIAKAKASSEGLFKFLMDRLKGFEEASSQFGNTLTGRMDQLKEGAVRVAAEGMKPLTDQVSKTVADVGKLLMSFDQAGNAQLNPQLVEGITRYTEKAAGAIEATRGLASAAWEHRDAILAVWTAYKAYAIGTWAAEAYTAVKAKMELGQASRLAAVQAAAEAAANTEVTATSRQKIAAYLAELEANRALAQGRAVDAAAQAQQLQATIAAIEISRSEVAAKLRATEATMAQARAQLAAAEAAGAQSYAIALQVEATNTLAAAQVRQAALVAELALLGRQQAGVQTAITAATAAQTAATAAATTATASLTAAQGAASVAGRGLSVVMGALGGPVGVAILAVSGLTMWLMRMKGAADEAATTAMRLQRFDKALADGSAPEDRDVLAKRAEIERLKDIRDKWLAEGPGGKEGSNLNRQYAADLNELNAKIGIHEEGLRKATQASQAANKGTGELTLTLAGSKQGWEQAINGAKTASSAQQEYQQKLDSSRRAFTAYREQLQKTGAGPEVIANAQRRQDEAEKAYAAERDKKIKEQGAAGATAHGKAVDAQVTAIEHGYKLAQLATADGLDAIDSLRKQDLISEYNLVQRRRDLALNDLTTKEDSLQRELELTKTKKDSQKEQNALEGQLAEVRLQRTNVASKAERDLQELLARPQIELLRNTREATEAIHEQARALEQQNAVYGYGKSALIALTIAQLEKSKADLEATLVVMPGYVEALERQIAAQKRLLAATQTDEALDARRKYNEQLIAEDKKTSDRVEATWRDGFTARLSRDQSAWRSYTRSLADTFKVNVADAIYAMFLRPVVVQVLGSGTLGTAAGAGGVGGTMNGANSLYNLYGAANGFSGGVNRIAGLLGAGQTAGASGLSLAYANAVGAGGGDALGALIASNGSWGGVAASGAGAWSAAAMDLVASNTALATQLGMSAGQASAAALAAGEAAAATSTAATGLSGVLSAIPGWGWAALAGLTLLGLGGGGETRMGGQYSDQTLVASPSGGTIGNAPAVISLATTTIDAMLKSLGSGLRVELTQSGLESSENGKGFAYARGRLSNGQLFGDWGTPGYLEHRGSMSAEEANAAFTTDWKRAGLQALQAAAGQTGWTASRQVGTGQYNWVSNGMDGGQAVEIMRTEIVSLMDEAARAAAEEASGLPKRIRDQLRGKDIEAMSAEQVDALLSTINTQIAGVTAFREAMAQLPFENLKNLSFDAAAGLIDLAGGLDKLQASLSSYYQHYYSDSERAGILAARVGEQMRALGYGSVTTIAGFRALVSGLDPASEASAKLFSELMKLESAFYEVHSAVDADGIRTGILQTLRDRAQEGMNTARDNLSAAYDREAAALQKAHDKALEFADGLRKFSRELANGPLAQLSPRAQYDADRAEYERVLALANAGDEDARDNLQQVAEAFLNSSRNYNASSVAYFEDLAQVREAIARTETSARAQADVARLQLDQLRLLVSGWLTVNDSVLSVRDAITAMAAAAGKGIANGVNPGSATLAGFAGGATEQWVNTPYGAQVYASTGGAVGVRTAQGTNIYTANDQVYSASQVIDHADARLAAGQTAQLISELMQAGISAASFDALKGLPAGTSNAAAAALGLPAFEGGGSHLGGWRIVGERGWEVENTGPSRIFNQDQLRDAIGGGVPARADPGETRRQTAALERQNALLEELLVAVEGGTSDNAQQLRGLKQHLAHVVSRSDRARA